jgi:hypothetical protein
MRVQPAGRINLDKNWRKVPAVSIAGPRERQHQQPQMLRWMEPELA